MNYIATLAREINKYAYVFILTASPFRKVVQKG